MKRLFTIIFTLCSTISIAENIKGRVIADGQPLVGAVVGWLEGGNDTISDKDGNFELFKPIGADSLAASFIGYKSQITATKGKNQIIFNLESSSVEMEQLVVSSRRSNTISAVAIEKKEMITFAGLCKMACCNIAESFENSASVTVGYSDAVSGARVIKLLGYGGTYTQMLDENRPTMRGLAATYGLEYTPGMWLSGIQISKGVTSVVGGQEALTGQINLEHRKPTDPERLFVNLFFNQHLRSEANITSAFPISDKLSTVILTHISLDPVKSDENGDGFADMAAKKQYNIANRWLYSANNGVQLRYGARFLYEEREGGAMEYSNALSPIGWGYAPENGVDNYGSLIKNRNINGFLKLGVPIVVNPLSEDDPLYTKQRSSNIALIADWVSHNQDSYFGIKEYWGNQNSAFANLMYQENIGEKHQIVAGGSFTADIYKEQLIDRFTTGDAVGGKYSISTNNYNFDRTDYTSALYTEYTFRYDNLLTVVAGARGDYSSLHGFMFTPRAHVKWDILPSTTVRSSAGVGYRAASLITDNIGILATGKELVIDPDINTLERGVAAGGSLTQKFKLFGDPNASISVEYFRTQFSQQVVVDQEQNSSQIVIYNLGGDSYTNSYQVDFAYEPFNRFTIYATYRYNDAMVDLIDGRSVETPLVDRFKGVLNLQYATKYDKWTFDFTAQLNGQSRLPTSNSSTQSLGSYSPIYPMFFGQITHKFRNIDVYVGCENIGNYRQDEPIISSSDPFSNNFNSTVVWGPLSGRTIYVGLRYSIKRY